MIVVGSARRFSPIGEYLRLVIMERLAAGPATVEELDAVAKRAVEALGVRYDWRVWPELLKLEIAVRGNVVELTKEGRWIYEQTKDEVVEYLKKWLNLA
ncbi:MAG: hypothetical protein QXY12_03570 [Pyrobaculum sp.]